MTQYDRIGRAWLLLSLAFAAHAYEEATSGFLPIYNQTVLEVVSALPWLPVRPLRHRQWISRLGFGLGLLLGLSPGVFRGARWARPAAYTLSLIMGSNAALHFVGTLRGRTVSAVQFQRPMSGFYTSPLLLLAATNMLTALGAGPKGGTSVHSVD